jgi:hypothetical protein
MVKDEGIYRVVDFRETVFLIVTKNAESNTNVLYFCPENMKFEPAEKTWQNSQWGESFERLVDAELCISIML